MLECTEPILQANGGPRLPLEVGVWPRAGHFSLSLVLLIGRAGASVWWMPAS